MIERLGGDRSDKNNENLPCIENKVVGENENNDLIKYLIMTYYTGGDRTMINHEMLNEFGDNNEHLKWIGIYNDSIRYLILNHVYSFKVRLVFDDGG